MKTLVLIACLLGVVYASKPQEVKRFHENVAKCVQELNKPPHNVETMYCTLKKLGMFDNQNKYILEKGVASMDDLISDNAKKNHAKEIIRKCYDQLKYQGNDPEINKKETKKAVQCGLSLLDVIDKQ